MDPLDRALDALRDTDHVDLATHGPMAAEALFALGYGEHALEWALAYGRDLQPIADPNGSLPEPPGPAAFGDPALRSAWVRHLDDEIREAGWRATARRWLPRLVPGSSSDAAHGLIRTGHALRSLAGRESPERRHELAEALAYWASAYAELPGAPDGAAPAVPPSTAIAAVPTVPVDAQTYGGLITERLATLAGLPDFGAAVSSIAVGDDLAGFANDLALTSARLYLANAERARVIDFVHAVDAVAATRELLPHLDAARARDALFYAWQVVAALHATGGCPWRDVPDAAVARAAAPPPGDVPELVRRAVACGGAHAIKFAQACIAEHALQPDPLFHAALADAVGRMEVLKERLGITV